MPSVSALALMETETRKARLARWQHLRCRHHGPPFEHRLPQLGLQMRPLLKRLLIFCFPPACFRCLADLSDPPWKVDEASGFLSIISMSRQSSFVCALPVFFMCLFFFDRIICF